MSTWQFPEPRKAVVKWLLDADPAVRWQVMRDLADEPPEAVAAVRSRIGTEGWGKRVLDLQSPDGYWGGDADKETWMYTMRVLQLLQDFGLDPASAEARRAIGRLVKNVTWHQLGGEPFFEGETEACINGRILGAGACFGQDVEKLLARLLREQLEDGGWNCEFPKSQRSSFHSTICVLEGLLAYERAKGATPAVSAARRRAEEYLLERRLMRRLSTGEIIERKWLKFSYPPTYHYDVLRGVDYFRAAGADPADPRLAEAIELVYKKQHQNGRWPLQNPQYDRVPFDLEGAPGTASRWNTLRALRVLAWAST